MLPDTRIPLAPTARDLLTNQRTHDTDQDDPLPMLNGMLNSHAIDVLEQVSQFAGQRHRLIAGNIANFTTPNYRPQDVDPGEFQRALGRAIENQRRTHPGRRGGIKPQNTEHIRFSRRGLRLKPAAAGHHILFHDRNDRDIERTMQGLVENTMVQRQAIALLKGRYDLLEKAIRERV